MRLKTASETAGAAITVLLLLVGGNAAFAAQTGQSLSLQAAGGPAFGLPPPGVASAGNQHYNVHATGLQSAVVGTMAFGAGTKFEYSLSADVKQLAATGSASFQIQGITPDNKKVTVKGEVEIGTGPVLPGTLPGMVPELIPLGCAGTACTSAIPVFFQGALTTTTSIEGSKPTKATTTMLLESPYFNPWGHPIALAATDGSILIVTTYDKGTIEWTGTSEGGSIGGLLGTSTPVSGTVTLVTQETENLVTGTTEDRGTMTFSGMTPSSLDVSGKFSGTSVIPKPGSADCGLEVTTFGGNPCTADCVSTFAVFGLPAVAGTCTSTGFQSSGTLSLSSIQQGDNKGRHQDVTVKGSYSTTWAQPALGFVSSTTATVSAGNQGG